MEKTLNKFWYIMLDDIHYYCGWMNDEYLSSTDEEDCYIFENKEQVYKVLEEVKAIYPKAEVYISFNV